MLGSLISKTFDEHVRMQKQAHCLKSITVEITKKCNLSCRHCYMSAQQKQCADELSLGDWCRFFDEIKKKYGTKISLSLTGGEAFVRKDIFDILRHIKKLGFHPTVVTNGLFLNAENISFLKNHVSGVSISLDGFQESHNYLRNASVFHQTVKNIRLFQESTSIPLMVKTTVYKKNINELEELYSFLLDLKIYKWHFFAMEPVGRGFGNSEIILGIEEYKKLCTFADMIKKRKGLKVHYEEGGNTFQCKKLCDFHKIKKCLAGSISCAILYNGDVVKCIQEDRNNAKIYGNITRDHFSDIWEEGFQSLRSDEYTYCKGHHFLNKLSKEEVEE